ncbi:pyridoxal phosphate-dependent aminotransferase [Ornithinicoccus hortensis]|uniref:Succinyldiaminopimelate aminotransferase n=2 Tax=Ornithinicoccus hortensis TaxID=82346 RepID=A0A542YRN4_9MICO|nr:pyridoxal phosphate-dependent aminotransferase [Ornithinicoccus hortensis]TQL50766.1 succinyldiaminopimelate aminotransferase [Ornithinicoccus hortensis]
MATPENPYLISRFAGFGETIFSEMTQRALQFDAVNLGQGFPDTDAPPEVLQAAKDAIDGGLNQYPPAPGMPVLRRAIADHQRRFYGLEVDPDTEVLVTVGATEAIAATVLALCEPGDEVVTFEPYFDSYAATVALAGATRRTVRLRFPDLSIDEEELRAAFSDRTRMVLLNSPHNPTGKVFSREEIELVGRLAAEHGAWLVSDEVYEHMAFDGLQHIPPATLPGLAERTITISSGGKTFSATGWKVGWLHGPAEVVTAIKGVKQFLTFVASGPFQPAIALGLELPDEFFTGLADSMEHKRDVLVEALTGVGLEVAPCHGTYFAIADVAPLGATDAVDFCRRMPEEIGVVGVPVSVFCDDKESVKTLVRFAFCKQEEVLQEAARRLGRLAGRAG